MLARCSLRQWFRKNHPRHYKALLVCHAMDEDFQTVNTLSKRRSACHILTCKTCLISPSQRFMSESSLSELAPDLNKETPRSPRATLGGFVVAARTLDKCRAVLAGTAGEYHYDCPLDNLFLTFAGITADEFKDQAASGADDAAMASWIEERTGHLAKIDIIKWNNDLRYKRISEMPDELQEFLEGYIQEFLPPEKVVYYWFDVYDIEEGRI